MREKLIVCSPQLGISPETNSGGEVYDREVLVHLAKLGVKSLVLLPKNRSHPRQKNLQVSYAPIKPIFPPYVFNFFVFPYLIKTYKINHFDILRVHNPYFVGPVAIFFKKLYPQVPLVASYLHLEETSLLQPLIDKILIKKFDHIITISRFTKEEIMQKYRISLAKISVAYPGVGSQFKPQRKDERLCQKYNLKDKKIFLFLGGLKKRKNPSFVLEVFKRLKDYNTVLLVAGDGPLKKEMILRAERLGINGRVVFAGFVPEGQKVNFYNLADIVLLPSKKEGFGMIASEAAACGKVVIVSNNSSLPEVVEDRKTGFLAGTDDVDDWLVKIKILLKSKNLRREMGARSIKFVKKKFSWEKNAKIHLEVFREYLRARHRIFK